MTGNRILVLAVLYMCMCLICLLKLQPELAIICVGSISFVGYFIVTGGIKNGLRNEYQLMLEILEEKQKEQHSIYLCNIAKNMSQALQNDLRERLINLDKKQPHLFEEFESAYLIPQTSRERIEKNFQMWSGSNFEARREFLIETIKSL